MKEFIVETKEAGVAKNGSKYTKCVVSDGEMRQTLFIWGDVEISESLPCYLRSEDATIKGEFLSSQSKHCLFLSVQEIPAESPLKALKLKGDYNSRDLIKYVRFLISHFSLKDTDIAKFIEHMVIPAVDVYEKFPAGAKVHHPWVNGLSTHTYEVLQFVKALSDVECAKCDWGVVILACLMHDYGKTLEYTADYSYTKEMFLYGHPYIGAQKLQEWLKAVKDEVGPNPELENQVMNAVHCVLSHHREKEFGAPVKPATKEAMIVSFCDMLSAQCDMFDRSNDSELNKFLGTHVVKTLDYREF